MTPHDPAKHQRILDAALRMIASEGFHGAPMARLAQEAGVGVGTIYRYFQSKEDVILALYRRHKISCRDVAMAQAQIQAPLPVRVRKGLAALFQHYVQHPEILTFLQQFGNSPYIAAVASELIDTEFGEMTALWGELLAAGFLKPLDTKLLMSISHGVVAASASATCRLGIPVGADLAEQVASAAWDAIRI